MVFLWPLLAEIIKCIKSGRPPICQDNSIPSAKLGCPFRPSSGRFPQQPAAPYPSAFSPCNLRGPTCFKHKLIYLAPVKRWAVKQVRCRLCPFGMFGL